MNGASTGGPVLRSEVPLVGWGRALLAFGGLLSIALTVWFAVTGESVLAVLVLVAVGVPALVMTRMRAHVVLDGEDLALGVWPFPVVEAPRAQVLDAGVVTRVRPLRQFGGVGWRKGFSGESGFVVGSGPALRVRLTGERVYVVNCVDPERFVDALSSTDPA